MIYKNGVFVSKIIMNIVDVSWFNVPSQFCFNMRRVCVAKPEVSTLPGQILSRIQNAITEKFKYADITKITNVSPDEWNLQKVSLL